MSERTSNDFATRMIDIGGRRLALTDSTRGSPTVVLETGLGAESAEWDKVRQGVAKFARVVSYDRASRGASDAAPTPRTARDMVDDLRALMRAAEISGPYLLVGHSLGGLLMRLYAHLHKGDVRGVIQVDAMHEDQFDVFGPLFPPASPDDPPGLQALRAFWTEGWRNPGANAEGIDFGASFVQAREVRSLGDMPMQVITAGSFLNQPLVPAPVRALLQQHWDSLQRRLVALSTSATHTYLPTSGHFVQRDHPSTVSESIHRMIADTR